MDASKLRTWTELLDLDGFEVADVASDRAGKLRRLTVIATLLAELCPHCGRACGERHACHDREVMDLPLGGWKTQLVMRLFQFRCERCDKFFTPRHPALAEGAHATERFLERLAEYATTATFRRRRGSWGLPKRPPNAGITTTWSGGGNSRWPKSCCQSVRWGSTSCL